MNCSKHGQLFKSMENIGRCGKPSAGTMGNAAEPFSGFWKSVRNGKGKESELYGA